MKKRNFKLQLKRVKIATLRTVKGGQATNLGETCNIKDCSYTTMSETQETELECNPNDPREDSFGASKDQTDYPNCLNI